MTAARRVAILGGAGFIGARLAQQLRAAGDEVITIGRGCTLERIDAEALAPACRGVDLFVHCAGGASVGASMADPAADFRETVPPTLELFELIRRHQPQATVILLSSAAVYGAHAQLPIVETAAPAPISPYGLHKRLCEEIARFYGASYGTRGIILRLFSVYGAGLRRQLLWDAANKARRGERTFAGTGREVRDWVHVDDACGLIIAAATAATPEVPIVNGGSGTGVTVRDVVARLYAELGITGDVEFTGAARAGDPPGYVADASRARALGWTPAWTLERGVADYARWFRGQT